MRGLRNFVVFVGMASLVRGLGAVDDPAVRTQFRCVDRRPAMAGPHVVSPPAFARRAALLPTRLLDAVPVRAVQRPNDRPALAVGHEIADVRVREPIARRASHTPVLQPSTDN